MDASGRNQKTTLSSIDPVWTTSQSVYQYGTAFPEANYIPFAGLCDNCNEPGHTKYKCPKLTCRWCGLSWNSVNQSGYHHNTSCPKMPTRQRGTAYQRFSPAVSVPSMEGQGQRSLYSPPTRPLPRQYVQRSGFGRGFPVSQSVPIRTPMGRGITMGNSFRPAVTYQSTHVGFDLQGDPVFEERPVKIQRVDDSYQVHHVGYDLNSEPMYEELLIDNSIYDESPITEGDESGYPV